MTDSEFGELLTTCRNIANDIKFRKSQLDECRARIEDEMCERGAEDVMLDGVIARYKQLTTTRIDTHKLQERYPEVFADVSYIDRYTRLTVS
ncbi:MAG: hypothetical protein IJ667_12355 [Synergistaceae bacterium]|nr:hypothetical protein [Synergistaceae bacterium]